MKASANRLDSDRIKAGDYLNYRPKSGWGYVSAKNVFSQLDAGYQIHHFNVTGDYINDHIRDSLIVSESYAPGSFWDTLPNGHGMKCYTPFMALNNTADLKVYKQRDYIIDDSGDGHVRFEAMFRADTFTVQLDSAWNHKEKLYAWGRSGQQFERSGWSLHTPDNFQIGWSRILNGWGGDSLNEGINHTYNNSVQERTFKVITGQFYVLKIKQRRDSVGNFFFDTTTIGNTPADWFMGANFTVYGRSLPQYLDTARDYYPVDTTDLPPDTTSHASVAMDPDHAAIATLVVNEESVSAQFVIEHYGPTEVIIFDALGRIIGRTNRLTTIGENSLRVQTGRLTSGTYIARIATPDGVVSRQFKVIR
jgi:hypothetical protein